MASLSTTEDHLPAYRLRPRFQIELNMSPSEVTNRIKDYGVKVTDVLQTELLDGHYATLCIPLEDQHYWTPRLSLSLEETENGTLLRGLYGPRPSVWTMFVFFYFLIGFFTVVISIIGLSNLQLEKSGAILWLVPILVMTFLTLYLVAFLGQRFGHDQMLTLHQFVESALEVDIRE